MPCNFLGYNSTSITVQLAITCHLISFELQMEFIPYNYVTLDNSTFQELDLVMY